MSSEGFVKNVHQSDHEWMITNALSSYVDTVGIILDRVKGLEFESILEFNPGSIGIFTGLIGIAETADKIKNYRLMDYHHQCCIDSYARNELARGMRSDVSFVTHVGNIWEYEQILPVAYRYRSDIVIVHYLSNTPKQMLEAAINEICRVSVYDIIVIDYAPEDCPIDVVFYMKEEMPDSIVHTSVYQKQGELKANECLYHVKKPPLQ